MPEVGEGAVTEQRGAVEDEDAEQIQMAVRRGDPVREYGHHSRQRVTHPHIKGVDCGVRCVVVPDRPQQGTFADEGGGHVRTEGDDQPARGAEPPFGLGVEEAVEHRVRKPAAAVDPERAGDQHPAGVGRQLVDVGGPLPQEVRLELRRHVVHGDGGDEQRRQPEVGAGRATDITHHGANRPRAGRKGPHAPIHPRARHGRGDRHPGRGESRTFRTADRVPGAGRARPTLRP